MDTATKEEREPSEAIADLVAAVGKFPTASNGMRTIMERQGEFRSPLAAQLTGIALDPFGRQYAESTLDKWWADRDRQINAMSNSPVTREVIIGSGIHAAAYAATRVLSGFPRPIVFERGKRVGGTFAMTAHPTFFLNSRNRSGGAGLAGDQGASLNYIPGGIIQPANVSTMEYQSNADLAFAIRLTLAQYADVITEAPVINVSRDGRELEINFDGRPSFYTQRIIDARGLGDPVSRSQSNGKTILSFNEFMERMATPWPLRGIRRVAVIGGGDSGKVSVEGLLGIGPQPLMAASALDSVERIDWFATNLPSTCDRWADQIRGRYQRIGRYLRPDRFGSSRLNIYGRRANALALPGSVLIEGRTYDLVVLATGNEESEVDGLSRNNAEPYSVPGVRGPIAQKDAYLPVWRVGPHARLAFTDRERDNGIADVEENTVSIFRTITKTAALAATLPAVRPLSL